MMSTAFSGKSSYYYLTFIFHSDVADKAVIMRKNKLFMIETLQKVDMASLNACIDLEIALGVIECNGDNNKKKLDSSKHATWEGSYNSSGRNLVRMWWLTKFLSKLLGNLIENHDMTLVAAC